MERAKMILKALLRPPTGVLIIAPVFSYSALIFIFAVDETESALAYLIYGMSAYSLVILATEVPTLAAKGKAAVYNSKVMRKISATELGGRYLSDIAFRGSISIYQGMAVNLFYVIFRIAVSIHYPSAWFISVAVYYMVLCALRIFLAQGYRKRSEKNEMVYYRRTAWLLFLLNIPMGGMIVLMIQTNSGYSYPGYIIYLSALYTFYTMILSIVNLVRYRRLGSPVLSAAKAVNFISAMMSLLGLQTAMISRFSDNGDAFRKMMNSITGTFVWVIVFMIAVYMLLRGRKKENTCE